MLKICKECHKNLPKTKEYFHVNSGRKDNFASVCKQCASCKKLVNFNIEEWYLSRTEKFKNTWKYQDIEWLYNNYLNLEKKDILSYFNNEINYKTITNLVYKWGIRKTSKNEDWSEEDILFLKENYPHLPQEKLQNKFSNRTWVSIKNKACKLNINRTNEVLSIINSESHKGIKLSEETKRKLAESRKGKRGWNWKGGLSPLVVRLRDFTKPWKFESLKAYNFKCSLSNINDGTLEVHHLSKNFSEIAYELFNELGLKIHSDMSIYSCEETELIKDKMLEIHYKYGLGVPLTRELHKKFHITYGNKNNTIEQFEEFKDRYLNGEFKEVV